MTFEKLTLRAPTPPVLICRFLQKVLEISTPRIPGEEHIRNDLSHTLGGQDGSHLSI